MSVSIESLQAWRAELEREIKENEKQISLLQNELTALHEQRRAIIKLLALLVSDDQEKREAVESEAGDD